MCIDTSEQAVVVEAHYGPLWIPLLTCGKMEIYFLHEYGGGARIEEENHHVAGQIRQGACCY